MTYLIFSLIALGTLLAVALLVRAERKERQRNDAALLQAIKDAGYTPQQLAANPVSWHPYSLNGQHS